MKMKLFITKLALAVSVGAAIDVLHVLNEDNDVQTRKLQSTTYLGCFRDRNPDRALPVRISNSSLNLQNCVSACRDNGYNYAGRQYFGECYCGNSGYDKHGPRNDCNDCNSNNVGGYRNCVYGISATSKPTPAPQSGPSYLGCFRDSPNRALPIKISNGGFSLDQCLNGCQSRGYNYAGRQYLGQCYCGNSGYDKHGSSSDCNACDSKNVGGYRNCVYELGDPAPTPPPTTSSPTSTPTIGPTSPPTPKPTPGPPSYLGCFRDSSNRALPIKISNGGSSLDQCLNGCQSRGYNYAGRQYLGECYCGNSGYDRYGSSNDCNACDSKNVGGYLNCVYEIADPAPTPPPTPNPTPAPNNMPKGSCSASYGYGGSAYFDYNNQHNWKNVHGNTNDKIRWSKFPSVFNFKMQNQCGFGNQSPINVCDGSSGPKNENAECFEHHRIFQHKGVWKLSQTDRIQPKIFGSKLRLEYKTRDWGPWHTGAGNNGPNKYTGWCPLIKKDPTQMCGPDLPPLADFPHHWNGFTQINHIDFKFPSEHTICGKRYAAEITYWFAWVHRRAAINMAIMVDIGNHNPELEKVIKRFEQVNQQAKNRCMGRNLIEQNMNGTDSPGSEFDYTSSQDISNDVSESHRQLSDDFFNPFSNHIVRTEFFYGYWGSTTEPPCLGQAGNPHQWITWRVMDKPAYMSQNQLNRLQQALLTNLDDNCKCTSVARFKEGRWSVARDLQPTRNRAIHKCRPHVDWAPQ